MDTLISLVVEVAPLVENLRPVNDGMVTDAEVMEAMDVGLRYLLIFSRVCGGYGVGFNIEGLCGEDGDEING